MIIAKGCRISLDKKEPGAIIDFISHAHSDHISAVRSSSSILTSDHTAMLIDAGYGVKDIYERRASKPDWIRMTNSGHMLGSKQLVIDGDSDKIIYTGDFQLQKSRVAPEIDIEECDTLIIDSTYPYPELRFEEREVSESKLSRWARSKLEDGILLFGSYIMGKPQEIIKILNEEGITPVVSKKIKDVSDIYVKNGIKLDYLSMYGEKTEECESELKRNFVGIMENISMRKLASKIGYLHGKHVFTAVATGFSKIFAMETDAQFCISDHADIWQSVEYINAANPKRIITYGHNAERFAKTLSSHKIKAEPMPDKIQI